ncbi:hypothetical protein VI817_001812 [Penicillium citrinum]|nr:hypothetical protein VI817_001812 [Penicillium citrinum]
MTREAFDPVAQLKTVSLKALKERSADEVGKLLVAAKEDGVFYLDLGNDFQLKGVKDDISQLSRSLFEIDEAEKMKFDVDKLGPYKLNG